MQALKSNHWILNQTIQTSWSRADFIKYNIADLILANCKKLSRHKIEVVFVSIIFMDVLLEKYTGKELCEVKNLKLGCFILYETLSL